MSKIESKIKNELKTHYVLFSVEGGYEGIVIDKLVNAEALVIPQNFIVKDRMTYKPYTRMRNAKDIAEQYLNENYQTENADKLLIARIIDSKTPKFNLPKKYQDNAIVRNFITSPEIEMLTIYKENAYKNWLNHSNANRQLKPSEFCKQELKLSKIKSPSFLEEYWDNTSDLIKCIRKYAQNHQRQASNNFFLADLLIDAH